MGQTENPDESGGIQAHRDFLRGVMDSVSDAIITIDEQATIGTFNRAAEQMFGNSSDEVVGQNVSVLMPDPYRSEHGKYIENYLRTGKGRILGIGPREVLGRSKDGSNGAGPGERMTLGSNQRDVGGI